ncbi:sugar phosphate nucleotidyltransferase [Ligilactobacillus salivarius]|uniref:Choline kinase n=1 Tax=Ligilactobacillus salivarius TaxID=1624 RepID=A0A9X6S4B4_9LACO|nr:sugar phosphate nucleotidyltransferase [Ligilactobacillus salivarius]PAY26650.1 choline kinase [Ligilactobacillus salivarius]PAY29068.1 choline kinase [Ligilactobacillus salivarius]PAY30342.1 choline kinase [Ligilactobacillus salivarius]PAY34930.1 choline kinase [Ligilactobacillus salivarius]PAY40245.1 choline kinase [Ligilactobacillus salivarius]
MSKVKRAIIMAAGYGTRLRPITLSTPKPLIKVNGIRMIESVIEALLKNDIREIYVVTGYLAEKFDFLGEKYPEVTLIYNPYYSKYNNISSLYVARDHLKDVIILDGDQIIKNDKILDPNFEKSGYNCVWSEGHTDEWLLQVEKNTIVSCSRNGGEKGWRLYSISRWNQEDGQKLKADLEYQFEVEKNYDIYWDDVALFCSPQNYDLGIREMNLDDVIEIDTIDELRLVDKSYD